MAHLKRSYFCILFILIFATLAKCQEVPPPELHQQIKEKAERTQRSFRNARGLFTSGGSQQSETKLYCVGAGVTDKCLRERFLRAAAVFNRQTCFNIKYTKECPSDYTNRTVLKFFEFDDNKDVGCPFNIFVAVTPKGKNDDLQEILSMIANTQRVYVEDDKPQCAIDNYNKQKACKGKPQQEGCRTYGAQKRWKHCRN